MREISDGTKIVKELL